ncbi:MAG: hypothetical protein OXL36_16745 [Bryobacterales bacterium]|nr:hypothetical protein [Bryobacterales bacterium]MDE0296108.1 hypothetical protein [Bryobacterales bacterium]
MNEQIDNAAINTRVFRAFYRTLQSEGFNDGEACELAQRGADLLTASHDPSDRDSEKPANAAPGGKAAEDTSSDSPYTYFFSRLIFTRRLAFTVLCVLLALSAFIFFSAVLDLVRAPRTQRSVGRSSDPRKQKVLRLLSLISILLLIYGLMMFVIPS